MQHNIDKFNQAIGAYESELHELINVAYEDRGTANTKAKEASILRLINLLTEFKTISHDMGKDWDTHQHRLAMKEYERQGMIGPEYAHLYRNPEEREDK